MNYTDIISLLDQALSSYVEKRVALMREGKYASSYHYADGYIGMLAETLQELKDEDDYYPLSHDEARTLIFTFNKMTYQRVPDIWEDTP